MNTRLFSLLLLLTPLAFGCSYIPKQPTPEIVSTPEITESEEPEVVHDLHYQVKEGDFLSAIAQKTTGNGQNWQHIARYNKIGNPDDLKVGDTIRIPAPLLRQSLKQQTVAEKEVPTTPSVEEGTATSVAISEQSSPIESASGESSTSQGWILVTGSYYPKAVYAQPAFTDGLLIRVLPGSKLKLLSNSKDWYQVETDKGVGYVHHSDATLPISQARTDQPL